ncbi:helix-turn-helix domain-containing protein [Marinicrinis sediminis]|uniref:Helix-turn-helix domain-containing protein n=1 Tax=Marinicrinis sediminis TaxID=1652465 RepID=A0ABW5RAQ3_9BACL
MSRIIAKTNSFTNARIARGWTQRDLAHYCNISPGYISLIERGIKSVGPRTAKRISEALHKQWEELFFLQNED